jgi:hypothetical protein
MVSFDSCSSSDSQPAIRAYFWPRLNRLGRLLTGTEVFTSVPDEHPRPAADRRRAVPGELG